MFKVYFCGGSHDGELLGVFDTYESAAIWGKRYEKMYADSTGVIVIDSEGNPM